MITAAKLVIIDGDDKYLLMHRSDHPTLGVDPDLPGGTVEEGESLVAAAVREVQEETGIVIATDSLEQLYSGIDYSTHGSHYTLFRAVVDERPEVSLSWEHSSYEWLDKETFLEKSKTANDTFMHMVYENIR